VGRETEISADRTLKTRKGGLTRGELPVVGEIKANRGRKKLASNVGKVPQRLTGPRTWCAAEREESEKEVN